MFLPDSGKLPWIRRYWRLILLPPLYDLVETSETPRLAFVIRNVH
jgi:hypothetical protein